MSELPFTFRSLYQSPIVQVRDYTCRACRSGPGAEEHSDSNNIVLMRHGAFCKHFGRRSVTADVNQAVFFSRGSTYRVSHPADCGDRGTVFVVAPRVLNDIIRELDLGVDDRPDQPFPFVTGPCETTVFWRHRELVQRLEVAESQPLEPIWADVTALQLIADVLGAAFQRHSAVAQAPPPHRRRSRGAHRGGQNLSREPAGRTHHARRRRSRRSCVAVSLRTCFSAAHRRSGPSLPDPIAPAGGSGPARRRRGRSDRARPRARFLQPQPLHRRISPRVRRARRPK